MAAVRWSRLAHRQLRSIIESAGDWSMVAASRRRARIGEAADRLRAYPLLGRVVPEFDEPLVRELIVGRYRFVYRVEGDTIFVVTIVHGSRDLRQHLPDGPWDVQ